MRDAQCFQAQPLHQRHAAGGIEHRVDFEAAAVLQRDLQSAGGFDDGGHIRIQPQVHAGLEHLSRDEVAYFLVKAAQYLSAAVQLRDTCAQALEDGRELASDVAAADHQQALRKGVDVKNLIRCDDMLAPGDIGHAGLASSGNECVFSAVALRTDGHRMRVHQRGPAFNHLHARALEQLQVDAVKAGDLARPVGLEGRPVQHRGSADPAKAVRGFKRFGEMCGVAVEFFGNAAHVHASAAHGLRFDQRNFGTALRRHARRPHTTAAATDHQQIKVKNCHENLWIGKTWGKP